MTIHYRFVSIFLFSISLYSCHKNKEEKTSWTLAVGTYTDTLSKGISIFKIDPKTLEHKLEQEIESQQPSFLSYDYTNNRLFAVNELAEEATFQYFEKQIKDGQTKWFKTGEKPTYGAHPCYIAVGKTGRNIFIGNYNGSNLVQYSWEKDEPVLQLNLPFKGKGPNVERQEKSHIHATYLDKSKQRLYVTDLGGDVLIVIPYKYTANNRIVLDTARKVLLPAKPGSGPRHVETDGSGEYIYLVNELTATLVVYNLRKLKYNFITELSLLNDEGKSYSAADVHLSPDEHFLYVSNRGETNEIVVFDVQDKQDIKAIQHISTGGKTPRNFTISPDGNYVFVANQNSHEIVVFNRDLKTGRLTENGKRIKVGQPTCLIWL